jgi:hypothetical protein
MMRGTFSSNSAFQLFVFFEQLRMRFGYLSEAKAKSVPAAAESPKVTSAQLLTVPATPAQVRSALFALSIFTCFK